MSTVRRIVITSAVTLAALVGVMAAQQGAGTPLTIQVTDISGAPIPKAQIEIMSPEEGKLLTFSADSRGIASLHLTVGEYQYRIAYPAFCPRNGTATIDPVWPQTITAKLQVAACPGCIPCVTPVGAEPPVVPVTIKVTDTIGNSVPDALVAIDPLSSSARTIKTANGQASIGLPAGRHSLEVRAPGFRRWKGFAVAQGTQEVIVARLLLAGTSDPEISIESPFEDFPLYLPQCAPIALQDLETLPLPGIAVHENIAHPSEIRR